VGNYPAATVENPVPSDNPDDGGRAERTVAPAVTAVVVAHRPGVWFEECLAALRTQDYARLRVVVLAPGGGSEIEERVTAVLPDAEVRLLEDDVGYGGTVNSMLEDTLSPLLMLCHDDVALAPDAVRRLVEEAVRSNAGIVGPKLVDWDDPQIIRDVGSTIDKTGAPVAYAEAGELDQEQHDAVRDVFMISGACQLLRSDLFVAVGGFDSAISYRGEDLDLCWRAHIAGARVLIAPAAVGRHRGGLEARRPGDEPLRLRRRHQVRAMLANYGVLHLVRVVPQALVVSLIETVHALLTGRVRRARAVVASWTWNVARLGSLHRRRAMVSALRRVGDADIRRFQVSGFAPVTTYLKTRREAGPGERRGRDMFASLRSTQARTTLIAWGIILIVYVFGVRHLLTRGIPVFGELAAFPEGASDAFDEWWSGWRDEGLGREAAAPIGQLFVGLSGLIVFAKMSLLRTIVVVGAPLVGAAGMWRLLRPFASGRVQIVAVVAFLSAPLPYNALANGSLSALLTIAAVPWLLGALGRAAQQSPYGLFDGGRGPAVPAPSVPREVLTLGLTLAVLVAFVPFGLMVFASMVIAVFIGSLITGHVLGGGRLLVVAVLATLVAIALQLPNGLDAATGEWALLAGGRSDAARPVDVSELLRFETGPVGGSILGWALPIAALLALVLARGARFAWAVRGWMLYLGSVAVVMTASQGLLPVGLPRPEVLLAPGLAGLALAVAMGMAAFESDLRRYRFGWRQIVPVTGLIALMIATLPTIAGTFDGRWESPRRDFAQVLSIVTSDDSAGASRMLWLGDPDVVSVGGWEYEDGVVYATTDAAGGTVLDRWSGPSTDDTRLLAEALDIGLSRRTSRLGELLGPLGVRYVVVPERLAPAPSGAIDAPAPAALVAMLGEQLDLERIELSPGLIVYRNTAWIPVRASVPVGITSAGVDDLSDIVRIDIEGAAPVLSGSGRDSFSGPVPGDRDVYLAAGGDGWELSVDGSRTLRADAFGWARAFTVDAAGTGELRYDTPAASRLSLVAQVLGWLLVLAIAVRLVSLEREGA